MKIKNKTSWERNQIFSASDNDGKIYAIAITVHHPLFDKIYNLISDYFRETDDYVIKQQPATKDEADAIEAKYGA